MNTRRVIYILVFATLIASIWGSIANRRNVRLESELEGLQARIGQLNEQGAGEREQLLGKTAGLQENLLQAEAQLADARQELVALRKENQALEARISGCNATISDINQEKERLKQQLEMALTNGNAPPAKRIAEKSKVNAVTGDPPATAAGYGSEQESGQVRENTGQLRDTELAAARLQQQFDACSAEIKEFEKIIKEKTDAMEETGQEMDRVKINLDVLLSRISDQQDELQELREENRQMLKEIAARNEQLADLQEKILLQSN